METFLPEEGVFHHHPGGLHRTADHWQGESSRSLRDPSFSDLTAQPLLLPQTRAGEENRRKVRLVLNLHVREQAKRHVYITAL